MNKKQAKKLADKLFAESIRARGRCEAVYAAKVRCNGVLQCCHIRSRRYMAVRWDPTNALCMCAAHHLYFTHHPLEWEQFIIDANRPWDLLRHWSLTRPPMDPFDVIESLRAAS